MPCALFVVGAGHGQHVPGFVRSVGRPGPLGMLNVPTGVAVSHGEDGRVYVVDSGNARMQAFAPSGGVIGMWGVRGSRDGEFWEATDAAVSPDGRHVYVVDKRQRIVQQFDADACLGVTRGRCFVRSWGGWGTGPGQFQDPIGIAVDAESRVFVVDWGAHVVQMFDSGGTYLATFAHPGEDREGLFRPSDIDVAPNGVVWVADRDHRRIYIFAVVKKDAQWIAQPVDDFAFGGKLNNPTGVAVGADGTFAIMDFESETGAARLRMFGADRKLVREEVLGGDGCRENYPHQGVALLPGGDAVVTVLGSPDYDLLQIPAEGDIRPLGPRGHTLEQFERPSGVALDPHFMVVADTNNRRVLVVDTEDNDRVIGIMGDVNPAFDFLEPVGVAVHRTGADPDDAVIYTVDLLRHRVYRGTPKGEWLEPWGTGAPTSAETGFNRPAAVAVDPAGKVYIADSGNDRVVVRLPDGTVERVLGRPGSGMGELTDPIAVAYGPDDLVYVVERTVSRLQAFAPDGEVKGYWPGSESRVIDPGHPWQPLALASDGTYLYVLENESTDNGALCHVRVEVFQPDVGLPLGDSLVGIFAAQMGAGPGQVWDPRGIAVLPDSWVAVADTANHRIQRFHWRPETVVTPTAVPPTATDVPPTATEVPPTATDVPPTATEVPPTVTEVVPTATGAPPQATGAPGASSTPTSLPASATPPTQVPTVEPTTAPTVATPWGERRPTPGTRHSLTIPFVLR